MQKLCTCIVIALSLFTTSVSAERASATDKTDRERLGGTPPMTSKAVSLCDGHLAYVTLDYKPGWFGAGHVVVTVESQTGRFCIDGVSVNPAPKNLPSIGLPGRKKFRRGTKESWVEREQQNHPYSDKTFDVTVTLVVDCDCDGRNEEKVEVEFEGFSGT